MVGMSRASENQAADFHAHHPSIVVTAANSPDVGVAVEALLPLLLRLRSSTTPKKSGVHRSTAAEHIAELDVVEA
jgi:hypothetical protein